MNKIDSPKDLIPRYSILAGLGAVATYLFSSLPYILIVTALRLADLSARGVEITAEVSADVTKDITSSPWVLIGALVVQCLSLFVYLCLVSLIRGTRNPFKDFGFRFTWSSVYFLGVGIGLQILGIIIGIPIQIIKDSSSEQEIVTTVKSAGGPGLLCLALLVGIIVPIAEELCFRGILQRGLSKKYSPFFAILIAGSSFGLVHLFDPGAFLGLTTLLIVGLVTSALAQYRGRIDASIFVHIGFNLTTVFFLIFVS